MSYIVSGLPAAPWRRGMADVEPRFAMRFRHGIWHPTARFYDTKCRVNVAEPICCTANRGKYNCGKNYFWMSANPTKQGFRDLKMAIAEIAENDLRD